jgi:beta-galactosidase
MVDGDLATGWSNFYDKAATALLPAISKAHASEWVSIVRPKAETFGVVRVRFTVDATYALPDAIALSYRKGNRYLPIKNFHIDWASGSDQQTTITFDAVRSTELRLEMTSPAPGTTGGFLRIVELTLGG